MRVLGDKIHTWLVSHIVKKQQITETGNAEEQFALVGSDLNNRVKEYFDTILSV